MACAEDTNSMKQRYAELVVELEKFPYKIGLFAVVISESNHFVSAQTKLKEFLGGELSERIVYCVLKEALTEDVLMSWYRAKTNYELANEEGKDASKQHFEIEMATEREAWSGAAAGSQMIAFYMDKTYPSIYGSRDLINRVKKDVVFTLFPAAPERIVKTNTAFKKAQESAAKAGLTRIAPNNAQIKNIENSFRTAKLFNIESIEELESVAGSEAATAVSQVATFIHSKMTQGAKIRLDELWQELQGKILLGRWKEISGFETIESWCNEYVVPIQWVVNKDDESYFISVHELEKGKIIGNVDLYNAIQFFKSDKFDFLQNRQYIREKLYAQICNGSEKEFEDNENDIMAQVRIKCGANVFTWASRGGEISKIVATYINKIAAAKAKQVAKEKISEMKESELRNNILKAMEEYPQLYKYFV